MHRDAPQSSARVLAPLALALCTVAFFYVVFSSGSGGDGGGGGATREGIGSQSATTSTTTTPTRRSYTVKTGDTLGGIAAKTGVPVATLQQLNPGLDPQGLVAGRKIKLR